MCLITGRITKIAKNDIICYKVFSTSYGDLKTLYMYYPWPGDTTVVEVDKFSVTLKSNGHLTIEEGLHAYVTKEISLTYRPTYAGKYLIRQMIIPKGTQYFVSHNGEEIVALAMRLAKSERKKMKKNVRPKRKSAKVSKGKLSSKRKKK